MLAVAARCGPRRADAAAPARRWCRAATLRRMLAAPPHQALPGLRRAGRLPRPGRRQPRTRGLHRLRRDPLRKPDQRRRHGAGVGRPGAAVPAQHRAALRAVDAAGGLHGARRDAPPHGALRETDRGSRRAHRAAGAVHAAQRRPRRPGAPVLPRAHARHDARPGPGDDRGPAVQRRRGARGTRSRSAPKATLDTTSPTARAAASRSTPTTSPRSGQSLPRARRRSRRSPPPLARPSRGWRPGSRGSDAG